MNLCLNMLRKKYLRYVYRQNSRAFFYVVRRNLSVKTNFLFLVQEFSWESPKPETSKHV